MTPAERAQVAEVVAAGLRVRYLAHDPDVSFKAWREACQEARDLRAAADRAAHPALTVVGRAS